MSFCKKGERNKLFPQGLVALTVPTRRDAESLQMHLCKLQYDNKRWVLNPTLRPRGDGSDTERIDDFINRVIPALQEWHARLSNLRKTRHRP